MFLSESERPDGKIKLEQVFLATLSFDGKEIKFQDLLKYSKSQATELLRQWQQATPGAINTFKSRYNEIRKITKRIVKNSPKPAKIVRITA